MKTIAFDLFGTIFDLSETPKEEIRDYGQQLSYFYKTGNWIPLDLPSSWYKLKAFPDVKEGLEILRSKGYSVATLSNAPIGLTYHMSLHNGLQWDVIYPLEIAKIYKTDRMAYESFCENLKLNPSDVTMVSANKEFGDLEAAKESVSMNGALIRHEDAEFKDLIEFANSL